MEALLAIFAPLGLLWIGFSLLTGRPMAPSALIQRTISLSWRLLRRLWREGPQRGGPGRLQQPRMRYRQRP